MNQSRSDATGQLFAGFDPFGPGGAGAGKPQLSRYLLSFAVPMAVLIGWVLIRLHDQVSRSGAIVVGAGAAALAVTFMAFDGVSYQAARAARDALAQVERENLFPLYSDLQSANILKFLLHGQPRGSEFHEVQTHNFLTGESRFAAIVPDRAYLLVNREYVDRLARRNLVAKLTPERFGMQASPVFTVDRPMPAIDYTILRALAWAARFLPIPAIRAHIQETADEALQPAIVTVYRLER